MKIIAGKKRTLDGINSRRWHEEGHISGYGRQIKGKHPKQTAERFFFSNEDKLRDTLEISSEQNST